jgi:hypothetical protein
MIPRMVLLVLLAYFVVVCRPRENIVYRAELKTESGCVDFSVEVQIGCSSVEKEFPVSTKYQYRIPSQEIEWGDTRTDHGHSGADGNVAWGTRPNPMFHRINLSFVHTCTVFEGIANSQPVCRCLPCILPFQKYGYWLTDSNGLRMYLTEYHVCTGFCLGESFLCISDLFAKGIRTGCGFFADGNRTLSDSNRMFCKNAERISSIGLPLYLIHCAFIDYCLDNRTNHKASGKPHNNSIRGIAARVLLYALEIVGGFLVAWGFCGVIVSVALRDGRKRIILWIISIGIGVGICWILHLIASNYRP